MAITLEWHDIIVRLALTVLAGTIIGLNRGERGRPAGLRTTVMVCLAACVSMIQVNLLLNMRGKAQDSFINLDLMRLPLGILSGMGFIGAGAILRRENLIIGVTTAATLWIVTVIGLCFGSGLLMLGLITFGLTVLVLWAFSWIEKLTRQERHATVLIAVDDSGPAEEELRAVLHSAQFRIRSSSLAYSNQGRDLQLQFEVEWRSRGLGSETPTFLGELARRPGVQKLEWRL